MNTAWPGRRGQDDKVREIETRCDGIAIFTLIRLGLKSGCRRLRRRPITCPFDPEPAILLRMRTVSGCLGGCLVKLVLWTAIALAAIYVFIIALNPWALHIGHRSTPLLWWHGSGKVVAKGGKAYPMYISFLPARPQGFHGGGRREGKIIAAHLQGNAWLCTAPGQIRRLDLSGEVYGGYASADNSLFSFRLLDWRGPFTLTMPNRGYFDLAGSFHGQDLVMDRSNEQGVPFDKTLFIDSASATFRWSTYDDFLSTCSNLEKKTAK